MRLRLVLLWLGAACSVTSAAAGLGDLGTLARTILGANQGVYVEAADGSVLLSQAASLAVQPASISKVPTTLALLRKLGPDYRFVTSFAAAGPVRGGMLDGDLVVDSGGDPYFLDENALLVAMRLNEAGVQRVRGSVRIRGELIFDWQSDDAAVRLGRALAGATLPAAWVAVQSLTPAPVAPPTLRIDGASNASIAGSPNTTAGGDALPLVIHRSQTLLAMVKSLNDYSNNVFKPLADAAGGTPEVESLARGAVPEGMRAEITLADGAGTDARNRLSPRVAVRLLRALEQELVRNGHALVDALPVAGIDAGTLRARLDGPGEAGHVVGKSGTFGDYGASALIGAISTTDLGTVYFAILNHGVPVPQARARQERFLRALLARLHSVPWNYQPDLRPAIARAQATLVAVPALAAPPAPTAR
jgi:D-alanyl-D-alanine carboxypeptidase/D-alanyl-D-alanine-endopeptidase (penicillin-binding protein 4)